MPSLAPAHTLGRLRQAVAEIDLKEARLEEAGSLSLGLPAVDDALEGGLACGALHEFAPAEPGSAGAGAACGFALALAALAAAAGRGAFRASHPDRFWSAGNRRALMARDSHFSGCRWNASCACGSRVRSMRLWAFEEALKSPSLAAVLAELPQDGAAADLTATRRLALAARAGSGLGLLLRQRPSPEPTAALTRWAVAGAPGTPDEFGGLGRTAFDLSLSKNRRGRCGRFRLWWNHDDRRFDQEALTTALSRGVAAPARDRPDHAPLVRAGMMTPLVVAQRRQKRAAALGGERCSGAPRPQRRHGARRHPRALSSDRCGRRRAGGRPSPARRRRRLVRPLHAAGRARSARRPDRSTSPAARISSAAKPRSAATSSAGSPRRVFARAPRSRTLSAAHRRWRGMRLFSLSLRSRLSAEFRRIQLSKSDPYPDFDWGEGTRISMG